MPERRYTDAEVAEIFQRATEAQQGGRVPLAAGDGMPLASLQEIGREVGIAPELIAQAARALDQRGQPATRRLLGLPIGVSRVVYLPRALSDAEWDRVVVDLRETFDARGSLRQDGAFRQWTNGNLQALLEPVDGGHRLRLRTVHGAARGWIMGGLAVVGVGLVTLLAALTGDVPRDADLWSRFVSLGVIGVGMLSAGAFRLPGWARLRRRQMEEIATRLAATTAPEQRDMPG